MRRHLVNVVSSSIVVIEVIEMVLVMLGDEVVWLDLTCVRRVQRCTLCQKIFQPTGGHCEAWLIIGAASLALEDGFVRSDRGLHRHRVLAVLTWTLLLPLDQASHRRQQEDRGHDGDGDDQDEQHAVWSRAGAGVRFWKREMD